MNANATTAPRVLIPLPDRDFDPTECAVPWKRMVEAGMDVTFATPDGGVAAADQRVLDGVLGPLGRASAGARALCGEMAASECFRHPISYDAIDPAAYDAMVLPGGHAPGMKQYLESDVLQARVGAMMDRGAVVGAICHGVVLLGRSHGADGRSVLAGRTVTTLPRYLEQGAWLATAWKLGSYYRTYPTWVATEVARAVGPGGSYRLGPAPWAPFALRDGNLVTARWPGDAERFAHDTITAINERAAMAGTAHTTPITTTPTGAPR